MEARTVERQTESFKKDDNYINGMPEYTVEIKEHIPVNLKKKTYNMIVCMPGFMC